MNKLENKLKKIDLNLFEKYHKSREDVIDFLEKYRNNFPDYTDHSIRHSDRVSFYISEMLSENELENLNSDEIYILLMSCVLHDIGMGIPDNELNRFVSEIQINEYKTLNPEKSIVDFIRDYHHILSYEFIKNEFIN